MASASDYVEQATLDFWFDQDTITAPATYYVAVFTTASSDSAGGTEPSGNAYARVAKTNGATDWSRTGSVLSNATAITFPAPTPNAWGTLTHWGLFDAATDGNLMFHAPLTNSRSTTAGVAVTFSVGALTISVD
jgi:hypothetical protein